METLNEILKHQAQLIGDAKQTLEKAQRHPPTTTNAPSDLKDATVAELREWVTKLTAAKGNAMQQIDAQIEAYQREIEALTDQR
jgi:hypothetical protein